MTPVELAARIREEGPRISARVMEEMWQDPFWEKRFGQRGRARAKEDAAFHVEYLAQAVEMSDVDVMKRYAFWLQTILTTRGMSTRHLDDNFARLAEALARHLPETEAAVEYLEGARSALRHAEGPARELQDACDRLSPREEIRYVLAHLADAIALGRPDVFAAHAKWLRDVGDGDRVEEALAAVENAPSLSEATKLAVRATAAT